MNTRRSLAAYFAVLVASIVVSVGLVYGVTPPLRSTLKACEALAAVLIVLVLPSLGVLLSALFLAYGLWRTRAWAIYAAMVAVATSIISAAIWIRWAAPGAYY